MSIGRAQRTAVPATLARGHGLAGEPDYTVAFALAVPDAADRTAQDWARTVFEKGPTALRPALIAGWRLGLRFDLGPRHSPTHVLGWRILEDAPERIVLTAPSPLVEATNSVLVEESTVTWATQLRCRRTAGRLLWQAIAPVHERTLPHLLTHAARILASRGSAG